jgi:hypothetical protein
MRAGKYTAIEVGVADNLEECFELVRVHEETGVPVMMLENCCYGRREMMMLNMVKKGLFGEVVHCTGGYHHYLPDEDLFKNIDQILAAANELNVLSFTVSGAGPCCLAYSKKPIAKELNEKISSLENDWVAEAVEVDNDGAKEIYDEQ